MRILITEDQPILITMLSSLVLEIYPNALIKTTTSPGEAEGFLKKYDFNLVISDLDFNGEKRFSIVELAKEYGIKCIVYSGHYNMAFIKIAMDNGAVAFVSKLGDIEDLRYALINYNNLTEYVCRYCKSQNKPKNVTELLSPELNGIEAYILDRLLIQIPRKKIAKELKITYDSLNTYVNRMTAKNNCNLLVLIHRYIIWKRSKK